MEDKLKENSSNENDFMWVSKAYLEALEKKAQEADRIASYKAGYREAIYDLTDFVKALRKE